MNDSQSSLIERVRAGDTSAYSEVIHLYQDSVRGFVAMWAPSPQEADDIAQEVFLTALRSIHTLDSGRDLKTWLLGVASNLTRKSWRRISRASQRSTAVGELEGALEQHALAVYQARERTNDRRRDALKACIESLPANTKSIFVSYVVDELSSAQLAQSLQTTDSTVRATISRIRLSLRECIERRIQLERA